MSKESRIEKIIFHIMKITDPEARRRIVYAVFSDQVDEDFTFKQGMAHALLTVFYQNPSFFLLGVSCVTLILPALILINVFS